MKEIDAIVRANEAIKLRNLKTVQRKSQKINLNKSFKIPYLKCHSTTPLLNCDY